MKQRFDFKNSLDWEYYLEKTLPVLNQAWIDAVSEIMRLEAEIHTLKTTIANCHCGRGPTKKATPSKAKKALPLS